MRPIKTDRFDGPMATARWQKANALHMKMDLPLQVANI